MRERMWMRPLLNKMLRCVAICFLARIVCSCTCDVWRIPPFSTPLFFFSKPKAMLDSSALGGNLGSSLSFDP